MTLGQLGTDGEAAGGNRNGGQQLECRSQAQWLEAGQVQQRGCAFDSSSDGRPTACAPLGPAVRHPVTKVHPRVEQRAGIHVVRVGRKPDPDAFVTFQHQTWAGRFDDPDRLWRTLYAASDEHGAWVECSVASGCTPRPTPGRGLPPSRMICPSVAGVVNPAGRSI